MRACFCRVSKFAPGSFCSAQLIAEAATICCLMASPASSNSVLQILQSKADICKSQSRFGAKVSTIPVLLQAAWGQKVATQKTVPAKTSASMEVTEMKRAIVPPKVAKNPRR